MKSTAVTKNYTNTTAASFMVGGKGVYPWETHAHPVVDELPLGARPESFNVFIVFELDCSA